MAGNKEPRLPPDNVHGETYRMKHLREVSSAKAVAKAQEMIDAEKIVDFIVGIIEKPRNGLEF